MTPPGLGIHDIQVADIDVRHAHRMEGTVSCCRHMEAAKQDPGGTVHVKCGARTAGAGSVIHETYAACWSGKEHPDDPRPVPGIMVVEIGQAIRW